MIPGRPGQDVPPAYVRRLAAPRLRRASRILAAGLLTTGLTVTGRLVTGTAWGPGAD
ncbi:hypothetical protein [Streptomyces bacillaris]|uniref:hypothetical protein n=1 Tax=Streptomyces bacillaris TaxID=68179 RepID=UPI0036478E7E